MTVTVAETPGGVTFTTLGSLDLTGLTFNSSNAFGATLNPNHGGGATFIVGPRAAANVGVYSGAITGPVSIGTGSGLRASSGTGDTFGFIYGSSYTLEVPSGYVSNGPLNGTATWAGSTFASLGLTPGTYQWSWNGGTGLVTMNIGSPVPELSTASMFGLAAACGLGAAWRSRKAMAT